VLDERAHLLGHPTLTVRSSERNNILDARTAWGGIVARRCAADTAASRAG